MINFSRRRGRHLIVELFNIQIGQSRHLCRAKTPPNTWCKESSVIESCICEQVAKAKGNSFLSGKKYADAVSSYAGTYWCSLLRPRCIRYGVCCNGCSKLSVSMKTGRVTLTSDGT